MERKVPEFFRINQLVHVKGTNHYGKVEKIMHEISVGATPRSRVLNTQYLVQGYWRVAGQLEAVSAFEIAGGAD